MPTAKPRVQITLTTPQHELLQRLAKLQKRSMSAVIAELFETVLPALERVAVVLQAAVRAQESQRQGLLESTQQAERDLRPHVAMALGQLDMLQMQFEAASAPSAESAVGRAAPARRNPRPVTRGSGQPTRQPRKRAAAPRKGLKSTKRRAKR
jgi:hypothetical protein